MRLFIGVIVAVFVVWIASILGAMQFLPSWAVRGQFGDAFGSVNSLFTGLAFAGVIYTIYLQRTELSLQRDELRLQREEMAASRRELANQGLQQQNLLLASVAELKIRAKEAVIAAIEMESFAFTAAARPAKSAPAIRQVVVDMQQIIEDVTNEIGSEDTPAAD